MPNDQPNLDLALKMKHLIETELRTALSNTDEAKCYAVYESIFTSMTDLKDAMLPSVFCFTVVSALSDMLNVVFSTNATTPAYLSDAEMLADVLLIVCLGMANERREAMAQLEAQRKAAKN